MIRTSICTFLIFLAGGIGVSSPAFCGSELYCGICKKSITGKYLLAGGDEYHDSCFERAPKCQVCGLPVRKPGEIHRPCEGKCPKCGVCSRPITEKYIEFGNTPFHRSCFEKVEKCGYCGGPIKKGQSVRSKGKAYHIACTASLAKCVSCRELISGTFTRLGEECYHDDCFSKLKQCKICGGPVPMSKLRAKGADNFHDECLEKSVECDICGNYIKGEYVIDSYGRKACSDHDPENGCFACHFPECVETLEDGRNICGKCRESSVATDAELWAVFKRVADYLERKYGISVMHDITLSMGSVSELQDKWKGNWKPGLMGQFSRDSEFLEYSDGTRKTVRDDFKITVLTHIPRNLLEGVVTHEYFHAWQAENLDEDATLEFKEGTAEAVSHQYYLDRGFNTWARGQKANKVELYRDNLLIALKLLGDRPVSDFVESIRGLKTFP